MAKLGLLSLKYANKTTYITRWLVALDMPFVCLFKDFKVCGLLILFVQNRWHCIFQPVLFTSYNNLLVLHSLLNNWYSWVSGIHPEKTMQRLNFYLVKQCFVKLGLLSLKYANKVPYITEWLVALDMPFVCLFKIFWVFGMWFVFVLNKLVIDT